MNKIFTILLLLVLLLIANGCVSTTPQIKDEQGLAVPQSIATFEEVEIGGINQYLLIRGEKSENPVLLFLHGGPGYPQIAFAREYQKELEKDFVVVQWDQRGAGKSYSKTIKEESMNREQFVKDTLEVVEYLKRRFSVQRIVLAGHSWGSELGIRAITLAPEHFHAYIGIGQVVHTERQEAISYDYVWQQASIDKNKKALKALKEIGYPPYDNHEKDVMVQRKWLSTYGGIERGIHSMGKIITGTLFASEYTWLDGIRFIKGNYFTRSTMFNEINDIDFFSDFPNLPVPVIFIAGRYDYNTPSILVKEYYDVLIAPEKKFFWFEESAHFPHFEEPVKFARIMHQLYLEIVNE